MGCLGHNRVALASPWTKEATTRHRQHSLGHTMLQCGQALRLAFFVSLGSLPQTWVGFTKQLMSIVFFSVSGTVLCVFLRGAGIVGSRTQDVKVDFQGHDPRHKKERDLGVRDAESNEDTGHVGKHRNTWNPRIRDLCAF
jgi:hypothetical protein